MNFDISENEGLVRYTQGFKIYITLEKLIKPIADPDILLLLVYFVFIKKYYKVNVVVYCMPIMDEQFYRLILIFFDYFDFSPKGT